MGWDIANTGGTSAVWRIYEGNTYPLLRSFLNPLTVSANDNRKAYTGFAYSGGNGVTYSGFVNGETEAVLSGSLDYGGNSQGAINIGSYVITPGGYYSNQQGYDISYIDGTLTIVNKAPLTILAVKNVKRYDGTTAAAVIPKIISGILYGTDTANFIETYDTPDRGRRKTLTVSGIVNDGNGGNNYEYTFIDNHRGVIGWKWFNWLLNWFFI